MSSVNALKNSKIKLKPFKEKHEYMINSPGNLRTPNNQNHLFVAEGDNFKTVPTPNFNQIKERKVEEKKKTKTFQFTQLGKKIKLKQNQPEAHNEIKTPQRQAKAKLGLSKGPIRAQKLDQEIQNPSQAKPKNKCRSKTQSRYGDEKARAEAEIPVPSTPTKFEGFGEDDDIIINPEFGRSLKESLKQSKRRLLLFIDNKEQSDPLGGKDRYRRASMGNEGSKNTSRVSQTAQDKVQRPKTKKKHLEPGKNQPDLKRYSLGLRNEEFEYSQSGEEDLVL